MKYSNPDFAPFKHGTYGEYFDPLSKEFIVFGGEMNFFYKKLLLSNNITQYFFRWNNSNCDWKIERPSRLFLKNFSFCHLSNGNVLIIGGKWSLGGKNSRIYCSDLNSSGSFYCKTSVDRSVDNSSACQISDTEIFISGGCGNNDSVANCYLFDVNQNNILNKKYLTVKRSHHTSHFLPDKNKVIVIGGIDNDTSISNIEVFCLSDKQINRENDLNLNIGRYAHTSIILPTNKILVNGGILIGSLGSKDTYLVSNEIIDSDLFKNINSINSSHRGRAYHKSYLFGKYVLIHGGIYSDQSPADPEFYDWENDIWYLNQPDDFDLNDYIPNYTTSQINQKIEYGVTCISCKNYYEYQIKSDGFKCWPCRNNW